MPDNNKITKNSFSGGRNTDVNVAQLPPEQYISAHNVDFLANGNFYALQNINSTTNLAQFANDPSIIEIGSGPCKFTITNLLVTTVAYCIVYFTMSVTDGKYKIWMFNTEAQTLHLLYEELYGPGYNTADRVVDIINYPENGVDHIYFTDHYNEVRQLTCTFSLNPLQPLLSPYDLSLQRGGANGEIELTSITIGGSLLSGTYQFAYRMCDPTAKRFTKWSSITNPVHVYDKDNANDQVFAGVGLLTNRQITLTITPSPQEIAALPTLGFIQLAVIENVGSTPATTVSLQPFEDFGLGPTKTMVYSSNTRIASETLDSFVIDPAQILSAKTLRTTNNRLFLGNVNYVNLEFNSPFNNGVPAIKVGTGSILREATPSTVGDSYSSDDFSSRHIGHFRDEVYRYGVVYKDKYGNRSYVSPLNMDAITDNQCAMLATGGRDMKFPPRSLTGAKYTLFNSADKMQGLGLKATINNHPTWAVSMEVVRVPRMKNILFQTPLVPMMTVTGTGVIGDYPSLPSFSTSGGVKNKAYPDAQPMTRGAVLVPKNLFWPEGRDILPQLANRTTNNVDFVAGEVYMANGNERCTYNFSMIFPTPNMYGDTQTVNGIPNTFIYSGSEKIDFVDQFKLRLRGIDFSTKPSDGTLQPYVGEDITTSVSGTFYAVKDKDYYFDSGFGAKAHPNISQNGTPMTGFQFYDNFGVTAPVNGQSVMDYEGLSTKGYTFGFQPSIQRSGVASFNFTTSSGYLAEPAKSGVITPFASGDLNPYGGGTLIFANQAVRYQPSNKLTCGYVIEDDVTWGYGPNFNAGDAVSALDIVNVKSGLQDNRYGSLDALHTYQSTGAVYTFNTAEQGNLRNGVQVDAEVDIWGGDCFVAAHTFKVSDSTYSITNSKKNWTSPTGQTSTAAIETYRWGYLFINTFGIQDDNISCLPVAVKNSAQLLTVVLEAEYNGGVKDHDILPALPVAAVNGVPIPNYLTEATCRTPLSYNYNFNLSRGNYQKVFTTLLPHSFQQYKYEARVAYSNIKVYNSDVSGFDVFSVADYYDLPEQRYAITSLAVAADMLYALQERGVVYLPTSGRQIEQADSSTLAVTSGDVIGRPIVVSTERGTQHLRSVQESGNMVFMTDNKNKEFYALAGTELNLITENQQTEMKRIWTSQFPENSVKGVYDFVNEQWLTAMPSGIQVYDFARQMWIGVYEGIAHGGTYQKGIVYMTAFDDPTSNFCIFSMYTAPSNNILFGKTVDPRVSFAVNPDEAFAKTFDVFMIDSSDKLATADLEVVYDTSSIPNNINGLNLAVPSIENNYRIPLGTDANGYRLRGMRMLVTAHWGTLKAQLKSIFTKYRYSKRTPF